jgi:hypothetical protein
LARTDIELVATIHFTQPTEVVIAKSLRALLLVIVVLLLGDGFLVLVPHLLAAPNSCHGEQQGKNPSHYGGECRVSRSWARSSAVIA